MKTFDTQIASLKTTFGQEHITLVGDRGMILGPQQAAANETGFKYISALHKAKIKPLLKEHSELDGCHAIVSDLPSPVADAQTLHDRYKDLTKVESGFRILKHGHLEICPWYVLTGASTRAHALTAMLALKILRRLQSVWGPLNKTAEKGLAELSALCLMELYETRKTSIIHRKPLTLRIFRTAKHEIELEVPLVWDMSLPSPII